jgi:hypothetical protein
MHPSHAFAWEAFFMIKMERRAREKFDVLIWLVLTKAECVYSNVRARCVKKL